MNRGRNSVGRVGSIRSATAVRRRRVVLALLLAAALVAPLVAVIGSVDAQSPVGTVWPPGVPVDPDEPGLYDYFWDSATRAFTPVNDFVRVAPGETVDLHMRANDVVGFRVCPSLDGGVAVDLQRCRDQSLHESAGGTCGSAVERGGAVRGYEHVITLCSGVYTLGSLTMLSGAAHAEVAPKQGAITRGSPDGTAPRGVVAVTGKTLGVAQAEYCMTSYPIPCRRWALIDIVVEPAGWTDARVVGVDDEYRLELDWSQETQNVVLRARDSNVLNSTPWNVAPVVGTYCCLSNLDFWRFDLSLPIMLGSDRIQTGRDVVSFLGSGGAEIDTMRCVPLYCDQIVPKNPAVSRWAAGAADSIGIDVEAVGKRLHVTLWGNPTDKAGIRPQSGSVVAPVITYCLAHWQQRCDASTCARATYRNAPNLDLRSWMNVVPSSAYVATTHCPPPAEVSIEVVDVTPLAFDLEKFKFVPPTPEETLVTPPEGAPDWTYRPDPDRFFYPGAADPLFWCFPGRFLDSAIGDLEGDAALWIDDPTTTAVSAARITRFGRYYVGEDADGNDVAAWPAQPARDIDPVTMRVRNRADLIAQIIEREYEAILLNPAAFPDRDPTIGAVWVTAAQEVYDDFVDPANYDANHRRHYLTLTVPPEDPLPATPPTPATIDDFIRDYVTLGGRWFVDPTTNPDPLFDFVADRDRRVFDVYENLFENEWDRESLWQGLVRSEYPIDQGAVAGDGDPIRPVDHRLLEDPAAQTRSCLAAGTTMTIVGAWGTYPGAANWGDATYGLCGHGVGWASVPPPPILPTGLFAWYLRDADCPADALVSGSAALPQVWLRDDPTDGFYNPRLGAAWEGALEGATACRDAHQCDVWAPPVPGYYQVRVRIERLPDNPFDDPVDGVDCVTIPFGDAAPGPECAYHHYLTDRTDPLRRSGILPLGWLDYWGPLPDPDDPDPPDPPHFEFDDLIWVTGVRVDATQ